MLDLDLAAFKRRAEDVVRARKIFIKGGVTKNISIAYTLYREMLLDDDRLAAMPERLNLLDHGLVPDSTFNVNRPGCPDCGAGLYLRAIYLPKGPGNLWGWKSCWECSRCLYEDYNLKTVLEWREELTREIG